MWIGTDSDWCVSDVWTGKYRHGVLSRHIQYKKNKGGTFGVSRRICDVRTVYIRQQRKKGQEQGIDLLLGRFLAVDVAQQAVVLGTLHGRAFEECAILFNGQIVPVGRTHAEEGF